jgi:hypothetical protein
MKHTKLLFQLVLTLNSSVIRAEYTRYWFDPQEWKTKQGPTTGFQGTVILALAVAPSPGVGSVS